MKLLLKNAHIISNDGDLHIIKNGFLGIDGDKIIYVSQERPAEKYDQEKDLTDKLLIPGLINGHTHTPMTILRGIGSDLPLDKWLDEMFKIEDKLKRDDISVGSRVALLEMIGGGTTSFSDMYFTPEATIEEVVNARIKANINRPVVSFDKDEEYRDNSRCKESIELYERYNGFDNGRILIDFSVHGEYTSTEKVTRGYCEACNDLDGHMHIHLSETTKEHNECIERNGKTPTEWFADLGAFDNSAQAAHCVEVTDNDLDILLEKGVSIVHNPSSNMKLGSGFARVGKFLKMGINVSVGTDGAASNNNIDLLEEMHFASMIHKGNEKNPLVVTPKQVFEMATVNGAKMQRRNDIGAIKVGNKADLVAIDIDKPHLMPHLDILATLTYSVQSSDVCMTMVDGEIIYENGIYFTIDEEKLKYEMKKIIQRLYY